jgi:hypothetical protein
MASLDRNDLAVALVGLLLVVVAMLAMGSR